MQVNFELKTKLETSDKAYRSQENEFEEFQKRLRNQHDEKIEEIHENTRKDLKMMKQEKDNAISDLEQVFCFYRFDILEF